MSVANGVLPAPTWGDLSVQIDRPDGSTIRWSGDELDAANVPCDLSFGTTMPGGFRSATCTLFRAMDLPGREGMFDDVTIVGPGSETVWQGRLQQMPTSTDSGGRVSPQAVGWSAHLEDAQTFREIYVDRELTSWGSATPTRRASILGAPYNLIEASQRWDDAATSAGPVIDLRLARGSAAWDGPAGRPHITTVYQSVGIPLGSVEVHVRPSGMPSWLLQFTGWRNASQSLPAGANSLAGAALVDGAMHGWPTSTPDTVAIEIALLYPTSPAGGPAGEWYCMLAETAVYGAHGVPGVRGKSWTGATDGPYGYVASDVLPNVLSRAAPMLRWTTGQGGTITPTDFPIRHLVFREACTAASVVEHLNRYHLWDWAVWERRTFYWHPRGGGNSRTWKIATADGLDLSLEGDTSDNVFNAVVVTYTDYAGVEHTVGPPGSGAERIDGRLLSGDPNNPATVRGLRRWAHLQLSVASDHEAACTIGQIWLGVQAQATRRGSATVRGTVYDDVGNPHPAWRVRAGDKLIVTDRPDDPPRRIIETNYTHNERSNQLTLDSTAATADALIERIAASLVGVI